MKDYSKTLQSLRLYLEYLQQDEACNPKVIQYVTREIQKIEQRVLLNQHGLDQELLYILWKDNRVINCIALWSKALSDLQKEAPCEYFTWLMKRNPPLVY